MKVVDEIALYSSDAKRDASTFALQQARNVRPNLSVNTDAPSAALRAGRGSPVALIR
jgi:hypothetical protein